MQEYIFDNTERHEHTQQRILRIDEQLKDIERLLTVKDQLSSQEVLVSFIKDDIKQIKEHLKGIAGANGMLSSAEIERL